MLKNKEKNGYYRIINQKTGRLKLVKHYKNGILNGKIIYYWNNGQIRLIGEYENMKRVGIWQTFNLEGKLIMEENYNSEKIFNPAKTFNCSSSNFPISTQYLFGSKCIVIFKLN